MARLYTTDWKSAGHTVTTTLHATGSNKQNTPNLKVFSTHSLQQDCQNSQRQLSTKTVDNYTGKIVLLKERENIGYRISNQSRLCADSLDQELRLSVCTWKTSSSIIFGYSLHYFPPIYADCTSTAQWFSIAFRQEQHFTQEKAQIPDSFSKKQKAHLYMNSCQIKRSTNSDFHICSTYCLANIHGYTVCIVPDIWNQGELSGARPNKHSLWKSINYQCVHCFRSAMNICYFMKLGCGLGNNNFNGIVSR